MLHLELSKDINYETKIHKVSKDSVVCFTLSPSLFGNCVELWINIAEEGKEFIRTHYKRILREDHNDKAEVTFHTPGTFHFYFKIRGKLLNGGYVVVEPQLSLNGAPVLLDSIRAVTVISKCLGSLSRWKSKMEAIAKGGYNMVHFTPIQVLGGSNSAYSLADQLSVNSFFSEDKSKVSFKDVEKFTNYMRTDLQLLSICDIVLNHTANETVWLKDHPECAYNLVNSPHLRPAYLLDIFLHHISVKLIKNEFAHLSPSIDSEDDLQTLRWILRSEIKEVLRLPEVFMVDTKKVVSDFLEMCRTQQPQSIPEVSSPLVLVQDPAYRRFKSTVNMQDALSLYNIYWKDCFDEDTRLRRCGEEFKAAVDTLNKTKEAEVQAHLDAAVENLISGVRYMRVSAEGPQRHLVTKQDPLFSRYFYEGDEEPDENILWGNSAARIMAHNGWVMNHDPMKNFAESESNVYLRRELIAWGDSVKLRFGESESDCPFLWNIMQQYVEQTARIFDGVRLDNCHSTPINVAQYMLDKARKVNPNLYVVAELFTGSEDVDNLFVNKLGITSLIRESMSSWDSHELGRQVYKYGGQPVGSFRSGSATAHALFMDQTHDNPSPIVRRSVFDLLPSSALVAMACCATGSNYGYDHLVPHHINVVDESREYMGIEEVSRFGCNGIVEGKRYLNALHSWLADNDFNQVFVDQLDKDIVCVTRHNRNTLQSYIMIAYTAFSHPECDCKVSGIGKGITVTGSSIEVTYQAYLHHSSSSQFCRISKFEKDSSFINGLSEYQLKISEKGEQNLLVKISTEKESSIRVNLTEKFLPGSVIVLRLLPTVLAEKAVSELQDLDEFEINLRKALSQVNLVDINYLLFKCAQEENGAIYSIPNWGPLVYCGLQGPLSVLEEVVQNDDQAHPICHNLREGPWLPNYCVDRLEAYSPTKSFGEILRSKLCLLSDLPSGMRPYYFYKILSVAHRTASEKAFSLMSKFVQEGNGMVKALALSSLQFVAVEPSAPLAPLPTSILKSFSAPTIAAGLPHFSTSYMRSWGRDTFISLRGLLLLTGRFQEARYLILGYGGCLRHGLIPNLLNGGMNARFNCRDAVWWWLYSIKSYCELANDGLSILQDHVVRLYPTDESPPSDKEMSLADVIQEALVVHFNGLVFEERNAGPSLDEHMTSAGFSVQIGVNFKTGFVFGGNEWNCGTWMDKMGSSEKAGTKGKPATPRDGSAVELVGLCYATLLWLEEAYRGGSYPYDGVTGTPFGAEKEVHWSWGDWLKRIQENFEREFWIRAGSNEPLVNKRAIYKDVVGASRRWEDFRLRPNFLIPITLAPRLFKVQNATLAVKNALDILAGPFGMKTLDPDDWHYCGDYDNSNDSDNPKVARGFNYHQGPEWVWPIGYLIRCMLQLSKNVEDVDIAKQRLGLIWDYLTKSPWRGLPELFNSGGSFCSDSCPTQAWSVATLLEACYDLQVYDFLVTGENCKMN